MFFFRARSWLWLVGLCLTLVCCEDKNGTCTPHKNTWYRYVTYEKACMYICYGSIVKREGGREGEEGGEVWDSKERGREGEGGLVHI